MPLSTNTTKKTKIAKKISDNEIVVYYPETSADQVIETSDRVFLTPLEKTKLQNINWNAFSYSVIPDVDGSRNLGSSSYAWNYIYTHSLYLKGSSSGGVTLICNTLSSSSYTVSFPSKTGTVAYLDDISIKSTLLYNATIAPSTSVARTMSSISNYNYLYIEINGNGYGRIAMIVRKDFWTASSTSYPIVLSSDSQYYQFVYKSATSFYYRVSSQSSASLAIKIYGIK